MEKRDVLWAALRERSRNIGAEVLTADDVRAVAAPIGLRDAKLIAAVDALADAGRVKRQWGGSLRVLLEPAASEAGNATSVTNNTYNFNNQGPAAGGTGARIVQHTHYTEAAQPSDLEKIIGALAAAVAELREQAASLPENDAKAVSAVADDAEAAVKEAQEATPDKPALNELLKRIGDGAKEIGRVGTAVTKTLAALKAGATALQALFGP